MRIKYGRTLVKLRKTNDVTQKEVADNLFVSRSCYASWEVDNHEIPLSKLLQLTSFYKVSIIDVMKSLEVENDIKLILDEVPPLFIVKDNENRNMSILRREIAEIKKMITENIESK